MPSRNRRATNDGLTHAQVTAGARYLCGARDGAGTTTLTRAAVTCPRCVLHLRL